MWLHEGRSCISAGQLGVWSAFLACSAWRLPQTQVFGCRYCSGMCFTHGVASACHAVASGAISAWPRSFRSWSIGRSRSLSSQLSSCSIRSQTFNRALLEPSWLVQACLRCRSGFLATAVVESNGFRCVCSGAASTGAARYWQRATVCRKCCVWCLRQAPLAASVYEGSVLWHWPGACDMSGRLLAQPSLHAVMAWLTSWAFGFSCPLMERIDRPIGHGPLSAPPVRVGLGFPIQSSLVWCAAFASQRQSICS